MKLLKKAVKINQAEKKHVAFLTDRILVFQNKKQIYGTQFRGDQNGEQRPFPIARPKDLERLRRSMNLESFAEYKKKMGGSDD